MSDPIVEARLAALEQSMRPWNWPSPFAWKPMADAPHDRDILLTVQGANGVRVCIGWFQDGYGQWRTITGQRIPPGCALAWMNLPSPACDRLAEPAQQASQEGRALAIPLDLRAFGAIVDHLSLPRPGHPEIKAKPADGGS